MSKGDNNMEFTAEVNRLLQILTHSIYSNKEIFLRELISNASDACDKLRYISISQSDVAVDELKIKITVDSIKKTITISDNGIGMTREEMIENLGTIARSGTKTFIESMSKDDDTTSQIGQFGIGFYSAFIVSKDVTVLSKKFDSEAVHLWSSDGTGTYSIQQVKDKYISGTQITIKLTKDAHDFADKQSVQDIINKYSDNINFPIYLAENSSSDGEQINTASAIWAKPKAKITEGQYQEHYNLLSRNFDKPLSTIHYKAEGRFEYDVLLYIPTTRPFDLFDQQRKAKLKLYVKRVLISDDTDIIPPYLRFVSGVIDCADIPLTVSREILQENQVVLSIKKAIKNRIISTLNKLAKDDNEKFNTFWEAFGPVIKEGIYEDYEKKDELLKLVRFKSSSAKDGYRSLEQYIGDMKSNQKSIYFITAEDYQSGLANPLLEGYLAREVEIIILTDPIDSFWTATGIKFEDKELKHVSRSTEELTDISVVQKAKKENTKAKITDSDLKKLVAEMTRVLNDHVSEVKINSSLIDSPVCISIGESGYDKTMQKILQERQGMSLSKPVLEVNPNHDVIIKLSDMFKNKKTKNINTTAHILLDYALIMDGEKPLNIEVFGKNMQDLISKFNK